MPALHPTAVGTDVIRRHTEGLADLADLDGGAHLDDPVPTCGDWTLADLTWHLLEVQTFWASTIANRPAGPEIYEVPTRPADSELAATLRSVGADLRATLDASDPTDVAWSWAAEQTVGFTHRRQSHEALVHHIDGLLALGHDLPLIDPLLGADGVDELVDVMLCAVPEGATFERTSGTVELRATDTGDAWAMAFGRATGTGAESGESFDVLALERLAGDPAATEDGATRDLTVSAAASDLDLWLWGRVGDDVLTVDGQGELLADLRTAVVDATQ